MTDPQRFKAFSLGFLFRRYVGRRGGYAPCPTLLSAALSGWRQRPILALAMTVVCVALGAGCGRQAINVEESTMTKKEATALIYDAIREGNLETVKVLLSAGADVNAREKDWYGTALTTAAEQEKGRPEIIKMLLAAGADVNAKGRWGNTALRNAAAIGNIEIVMMLLSAGAKDREMSSKDRDFVWNDTESMALVTTLEETALMAASRNGHTDVVRVLLAAGSDVINTKDMLGETALSLAKNPEIIRLLREAGAEE